MKSSLLQVTLAALGGFLAWFLGGIDVYIYILIIFVVCDYITGIMKAISERKLSSKIGAKGIFRKALIFIIIGLSNLIDEYVLRNNGMFRTILVFFYISNEGISILENANVLGLPIPEKLKSFLLTLKDKPQ